MLYPQKHSNYTLFSTRFTKNAKIISNRFRDQPQKPLDRAVWWIEYILRNPNPEHLQSPTIALGWFASNSYDVLLAALVILVLIFALIFAAFRKCFMAINSRSKHSVTKKNNWTWPEQRLSKYSTIFALRDN